MKGLIKEVRDFKKKQIINAKNIWKDPDNREIIKKAKGPRRVIVNGVPIASNI